MNTGALKVDPFRSLMLVDFLPSIFVSEISTEHGGPPIPNQEL